MTSQLTYPSGIPVAVFGTVDRRDGGDVDLAGAGPGEGVGAPRSQPDGRGTQAFGRAGGGEQRRRVHREGTAALVEVVDVVVVADEDDVDGADLVLGDGRALGLRQVALWSGGVEGRVADDA